MISFFLAAYYPSQPAVGDSLLSYFHFDQAWQALYQYQQTLGTSTSGPLGALVLSFFLISLMWTWVKNKFDTWSFWDVFLRGFLVAAGLVAWTPVFRAVDSSLVWLASGAGTFHTAQDFYDLVYAPFDQLVIQGASLNIMNFSGVSLFDVGLLIPMAIDGLLEALIIASYAVTLIIQQLMVMFLYAVGPLFLACYLLDPLADLWMRWVRSYLTLRTWTLVIHFFLFILATAVRPSNMGQVFSTAQNFTLPTLYLLILLIVIAVSFPVARGLVGGAVAPFMSGAVVPGIAAAGVATGAAVVGMAAGSAAGPGGSMVGGAIGGGAGSAAKKVIVPNREA